MPFEWDSRKVLMLLLSLDLFAMSGLLIMTANEQGPLYDIIKPTAEQRYYILIDQHMGDIIDSGILYDDCLIFNVQPLDVGLNPCGSEHKLYFANENKVRSDLRNGEIIICTWVIQITGQECIQGVVSYEYWEKMNEIDFEF